MKLLPNIGSLPPSVPANIWSTEVPKKRKLAFQPLRENQVDASLTVETFLSNLANKKAAPRTLAFYRHSLEKFARYCPKPISEVTPDDVYAFLTIARESRGAYAVYNYKRAIMKFLRDGGSQIQVKNPKFAAPAAEEYTPEQLETLFSVGDAKPSQVRLFSFYLMTGCTEQEVTHAVWENLTASQYTVASVGDWKPQKPRVIPISAKLSALLEPARSTGLIFPNIHRTPDGHHLKKLGTLAKKSGQDPKEFSLIKFRHTYAIRLLRAGVPSREVANRLGLRTLVQVTKYRELAEGDSARIRKLADSAF